MKKAKKENKSIIALANKELDSQLSDSSVMRALIATTFSGFRNELIVKQACLEAMMRGYSFQDILSKKIYAIPFKGSYALVQSIADVRAIAMKSGQVGKSAPTYVEDDKGNIISCSITIKKKIGETVGDYTATVFFKEYNTGYNQWASKPRTMIAKVAEMHANRMAFPEVLHQAYIEGEFEESTTKKNADNASKLLQEKVEDELAEEIVEKTVKEIQTESAIGINESEVKNPIPKATELTGKVAKKVVEGEIETISIEEDEKDIDEVLTIDSQDGEAERIRKLIKKAEAEESDILKFYEVEKLEDFPVKDLGKLEKILITKAKNITKAEKNTEPEKGIPGDVCEYLNSIKNTDESTLPGDIMLLKLDSNKGVFRGYDAYPSLADELKK